MDKAVALFCIAVGLVYSEFDSIHWFYGYALPAILTLGLAYLFWPRGFIAIAVGVVSYHYMDISSQSVFTGIILPLLFALSVVYFIWWLGLAAITEQARSGRFGAETGDSGSGCGDGGDGSC